VSNWDDVFSQKCIVERALAGLVLCAVDYLLQLLFTVRSSRLMTGLAGNDSCSWVGRPLSEIARAADGLSSCGWLINGHYVRQLDLQHTFWALSPTSVGT
jgi:hypothetical protein